MIYLASPYTDPNPQVEEWRFEAARRCAAYFIARELPVYSPIAYGHSLVVWQDRTIIAGPPLPKSHEFWMRLCLPMVEAATVVWVLTLEGWRESKGCAREMAVALANEIPVCLLEQDRYTEPDYKPEPYVPEPA